MCDGKQQVSRLGVRLFSKTDEIFNIIKRIQQWHSLGVSGGSSTTAGFCVYFELWHVSPQRTTAFVNFLLSVLISLDFKTYGGCSIRVRMVVPEWKAFTRKLDNKHFKINKREGKERESSAVLVFDKILLSNTTNRQFSSPPKHADHLIESVSVLHSQATVPADSRLHLTTSATSSSRCWRSLTSNREEKGVWPVQFIVQTDHLDVYKSVWSLGPPQVHQQFFYLCCVER